MKSLEKVQKKDVFILNGDTFFSIDLNQLKSFHENRHADLTIALKKLENTQRYGTVNIDKQQEITGFIEKKEGIEGYINGGIYILNKSWFHSLNFEEDFFSFETEILQKKYQQSQFYGLAFDDYFIDIGIPEDYEKAKVDFKKYISKSYYTQ